jgi:hypothetical protein
VVLNWLFGVCESWVMVSSAKGSLKCLVVPGSLYAFSGRPSSLYQILVCGLLAFLPLHYRTT